LRLKKETEKRILIEQILYHPLITANFYMSYFFARLKQYGIKYALTKGFNFFRRKFGTI